MEPLKENKDPYLLQFLQVEWLMDVDIFRDILFVCERKVVEERSKLGLAQGDHYISSPNHQLWASSPFSLLSNRSQVSLSKTSVKLEIIITCAF